MIDPVQILWSPAGVNMPALGARALVDVTDGDTPNIRMPIRMLSVDTPEVTARTADRASVVDTDLTTASGRAAFRDAINKAAAESINFTTWEGHAPEWCRWLVQRGWATAEDHGDCWMALPEDRAFEFRELGMELSGTTAMLTRRAWTNHKETKPSADFLREHFGS